MIEPRTVADAFRELFGREPRLFRAPGRVNLIGEHTDYNDGFVLPMAIERDTVVGAAAREDRVVRAHSRNMKETVELNLDSAAVKERGEWLDYIEGIARSLEARGVRLHGADLMIDSDVPDGAGLSSSAALEMSVGRALVAVSGAEIDPVQLALAGQTAEHVFVGTKSGIMDQFIASLGQADHALLIDCRSLEARPVPLALDGAVVGICDTRVKHSLASSEYNTRRSQCERGVELLRSALPGVTALRDVTVEQLVQHQRLLPEVIYRRCYHVVTENARTLAAAEALSAGRLDEMGRLMVQSHESLRDDYEVSSPELDILVEAALASGTVYGARMTGGGFGGCTVNIVRPGALAEFQSVIAREYERRTGTQPHVYTSRASAGAGEVSA